MIQGQDFIFVGLQAIDGNIGSNSVNIAREISHNNRVLYVNYPLDRLTKIRKKNNPIIQKRLDVIKGKSPELEQLSKNLWTLYPKCIVESISRLSIDWLFDKINKSNNKRFAARIQKAIDTLGFKDYIIFNDTDVFRSFYLKEILHPKLYIYYTRDNMMSMPFWAAQGVRIEPMLMAKADFIVANSAYLANIARKFNENTFDIGQGCDLTLFDKKHIQATPKDIANIQKPIIGYIGVLFTLRLDIEIIAHLAKTKPDYQVVLIGPEDENFKNSNLHSLPNVHFLGNKKTEELPSYLNCFDICINPQILNETTIGNYPRKIDEYLALGKPTVATKTIAMEMFSEHVYLAENKKEYVELIEKALNENTPEKEKAREAFAKTHTWENNVEKIYQLIQKFLSK
ncbi:MAG: glycosyltransferase [Lentimicrobiaceae bacterium]|nr:glycosyltransferase [Lentimicrobiaceae bacterium]